MSGGSQKLWGDVSPGRFAEAQKFANQGQWGQAAQQYQLGGGQSFTQPQYQAFTQQYGNAGSPAGQLGGVFGQPGVPHPESFGPPGGVDYYPGEIIADGPGSGMWGPPDQPKPIGEYVSNDSWIPPAQAQPAPPPAQMLPPTPTPPRLPSPTPIQPTAPNWASYVQGNPDLLNAYNKGSPQSIGDWGKSHWESFGQNESRAVNPYSGLLT
tara:strand:+ start:191 stop:820 length:630 start_codon:yes stop_codon:yes gene_type:complete